MWISDDLKEVREAIKNLDCDEQVSEVLAKIVDIIETLDKTKANRSVRLK